MSLEFGAMPQIWTKVLPKRGELKMEACQWLEDVGTHRVLPLTHTVLLQPQTTTAGKV